MQYCIGSWTVPRESYDSFGLCRLAEAVRYDWPHGQLVEQWCQQGHWRLFVQERWSADQELYTFELWAISSERVQLIWDVLSTV